MLPGELDPKLALAATAELRGAHADATRYYETVWRTNHTFYSAAFGLARERARAGDRAGAVETLDQITPASTHYTAAGTAGIEILLDGRAADDLDEAALLDAGKRASSLTIESAAKREITATPGARRGAGLAARGEHPEDRAAARLRLRTNRASGSGWSTATAHSPARRPTCGRESTWWKRPMRSDRGPDYERRGGDVYAVWRDGCAR